MPEQGRCFSMKIGKFVWAGERLRAATRSSVVEKGEQKEERDSTELREVASGSVTPCLWLRNGKVRSQVIGIDQNQFPGRGTVGEIRREGRRGRRASDAAKKRVYSFWV